MTPAIDAGAIWILRLLDVADAIDLEAARALLAERGPRRGAANLLGPERNPGGGVVLATRPLDVDMAAMQIDGLDAQTAVRLFEFGVASVRFRVPIAPGTTCEDLAALSARLEGMALLDDAAHAAWTRLAGEIRSALKSPHDVDLVEDYTVFAITRVTGCDGATAMLTALEPARVLLAEPARPLAPDVLAGYRSRQIQYYADDAAVIGWSGALVIDPDESTEPLEVLEVANARLLELRYYDRLLARELARVYTSAEAARGASTLAALLRSPFASVARRAATLFVETGELYDRLGGAMSLVGDAYTTRLYREAAHRLRIEEISAGVKEKLATLARVSEVFETEVNHRRAVLLETTIVLLIVLEVILGLLRPH